jgi:hypothetical protein
MADAVRPLLLPLSLRFRVQNLTEPSWFILVYLQAQSLRQLRLTVMQAELSHRPAATAPGKSRTATIVINQLHVLLQQLALCIHPIAVLLSPCLPSV